MARQTTIQTFSSVTAIKQAFGITLPKPYDWRLLSPCVVGEMNALPNMRGVAVATNGILVAILQNATIIIGHLDYFVADQEQAVPKALVGKKSPKPTRKVNIEEFC